MSNSVFRDRTADAALAAVAWSFCRQGPARLDELKQETQRTVALNLRPHTVSIGRSPHPAANATATALARRLGCVRQLDDRGEQE